MSLADWPRHALPRSVTHDADILAVAGGTVVSTLNTLDDQVPGQLPDPSTITLTARPQHHRLRGPGVTAGGLDRARHDARDLRT